MGMRVTKAHNWPYINVESVNATKRGRDTTYTEFVAQGATKMPCGQEIHERTRNNSRSDAESAARDLAKRKGNEHLRECGKDKCKASR